MTVFTDKRYQELEQATVAEAEERLKRRFIEVYGPEEGGRRLRELFERMAANIRSDSRMVGVGELPD